MNGEPLSVPALATHVRRAQLARLQTHALLAQPPASDAASARDFGVHLAYAACEPATRKSSFDLLVRPDDATLRGHVAALIGARLALPYDVRKAALWHAAHAPFASELAPNGSARVLTRQALLGPTPRANEALAHAVLAARGLGEIEHEQQQARVEIARRLALADPEDLALPVPHAALRASAARFLVRSQDIAESVLRKQQDLAEVLAFLRGADLDGLPARLSHRFLADVLPGFATARVDPRSGSPFARLLLRELPERAGLSSFARALTRLGEVAVLDAPLEAPEWVRRIDGALLAPTRAGLLFATLLGEPSFVRSFDTAASEREAIRRRSAIVGLFAARRAAADLCGAPSAGQRDELEGTLFVRPLPRGAYGVLPRWRARASDYAAWLELPGYHARARELFDEDWFRNPRSRSWVMLPEPSALDAERLMDAEYTLVRSFEQACA